jgi:hypothetical protein
MVAVGDQTQHLFVHADELVLGQRLLVLPVDECLGDLLLEVAGLHRVDHLHDD